MIAWIRDNAKKAVAGAAVAGAAVSEGAQKVLEWFTQV